MSGQEEMWPETVRWICYFDVALQVAGEEEASKLLHPCSALVIGGPSSGDHTAGSIPMT